MGIGKLSQIYTISAILLSTFISTTSAAGCQNCLNVSADNIRYGCFQSCDKAFASGESENTQCRQECTNFVFDEHCCSGTCSADATKCFTSNFQNPMPEPSFKKRDAAVEYEQSSDLDLIMTPVSGPAARRSAAAASDTDSVFYAGETGLSTRHANSLEARVDAGKVCCQVASSILGGGLLAFGHGFAAGGGAAVTDEDKVAGMILIAFSSAASFACSKIYKIHCIFDGRLHPTPTA